MLRHWRKPDDMTQIATRRLCIIIGLLLLRAAALGGLLLALLGGLALGAALLGGLALGGAALRAAALGGLLGSTTTSLGCHVLNCRKKREEIQRFENTITTSRFSTAFRRMSAKFSTTSRRPIVKKF